MNGIRNFILDNIRYIVSGILLIFIVLILVKCTGEEKASGEKVPEGENVVASEDEQQNMEQEEPSNDLVVNAYPAVNALIEAYFQAKADGDLEAFRETVSVQDEDEEESVTKMSQHIESYNNITCYTKNGPETGSYVAYVCYDIKFQNVDTMAPSLTLLYVCTASDGSLYINNGEWDTAVEAAINELNNEEDVQELIAQVESAFASALEQDDKLSNLASTIQTASSETEESGDDQEEESEEDTVSDQETVYAKETVNVRSQASETADRIGQIARGDSATRLSEENGWSKISYNNATAYVKSEYLTTDKSEIQTSTQNTESPSSGKAQITETARMRKGEATDSELIETLFPGTQVEIVEKLSSGRTKITYNGKTGYVNSECLGKIG